MDSGIEIVYQVIDYNDVTSTSDPVTVQVSKMTNILTHVSFEITTADFVVCSSGRWRAVQRVTTFRMGE